MNRIRTLLAASTLLAGGIVFPGTAHALPSSAVVNIPCGIYNAAKPDQKNKCKKIKEKDGRLVGYVEWYSDNVLIYTEHNPRIGDDHDGHDGSIEFVVSGDDDPAAFNSWYVVRDTAIFNMPNLWVKVYEDRPSKRGPVLAIDQAYTPYGSALWAQHSGDTANLQGDIAAEAAARIAGDAAEHQHHIDGDAAEAAVRLAADNAEAAARLAADNAEAAARQAADTTLTNNLATETTERKAEDASLWAALQAEIAARSAGDANLQAGLAAETTARELADAALTTALNTEIDDRKAGDVATLNAANTYADGIVANEAGLRIAGDAAEHQHHIDGDAAEAAARAAAVAALQASIAALQVADNNLQANIDAEAAIRAADDITLQATLNAETTARMAADAAMQAAITALQTADATLQANIDAEAAARLAGDAATLASANNWANALNAAQTLALGNETALRIAGDLANQVALAAGDAANAAAIAAEATTRANADTALNTALTNETNARVAGDNTNAAAIAAETTARTNADTTLTNAINAEIANRTAADTALSGMITAETAARVAGDNMNAAAIAAEAATRAADDAAEAATRAAADTGLQGQITAQAAKTITVTAGTGMSGGGNINVGTGGAVTLTNSGVTSVIAGSGIAVSGATGAVTITSTAVGAGSTCGGVNAGVSCAASEGIGQLGWGASKSRSSALPSGGSAEHWYTVSWANSGNSYHPHVYLSAGAAYYVIDVFTDCGGTSVGCTAGGFHQDQVNTSNREVSKSVINWETNQQGEGPMWNTPSPGTTAYVRVRPLTNNPTCQSYSVVFVNG